MEQISRIIMAVSVLIASGATIHLGVEILTDKNCSGSTIRYALAMTYTAIYAVLFSIGTIIQAVAKLIGGT